MGPFGMSEMMIVVALAILVAVAVGLVGVLARGRRTDPLGQAIEANQPDVALALIRARWSRVSLIGFVMSGAGLAQLGALAWHPQQLAGLLVFAGVLLCAGCPMALFGYFQARADGRPGTVAWVVPAIAGIAAAGVVFWVGGRVHFGLVPTAKEVRDFRDTVQRMIGAPPGTASPLIEGHRAKPCLTGNNYAIQSCGTPYHEGIRFATTEPGPLNVYYIPDTDQYLVIGRARVTPAGVIVESGFISAQEALGQTRGKAN